MAKLNFGVFNFFKLNFYFGVCFFQFFGVAYQLKFEMRKQPRGGAQQIEHEDFPAACALPLALLLLVSLIAMRGQVGRGAVAWDEMGRVWCCAVG